MICWTVRNGQNIHDTNKITIFRKKGKEIAFATKSKDEVAKDIVDTIIRFHYA